MVVVPVAAVNCSRPYSRGALILQAIAPLRKLGPGHARLGSITQLIIISFGGGCIHKQTQNQQSKLKKPGACGPH